MNYISYNGTTKDTSTSISGTNVSSGAAGKISWSGTSCTYSSSRVNIAANGSITFTAESNYQITKIVMTTGTSADYVGTWSSTSGDITTSSDSKTVTIDDINANSVTITTSTAYRCTSAGSISIYYTSSGGGNTPSITANDVNIAYDATNGSIGYTLQNATGNVSAVITDGDWLELGTITSTEVPFTCSANSSATARTAKVTLSFEGATDKVVTVTQAAAPLTPISITLSGTYPTTFIVGDEFSHEGMTVTATYSDNSTNDVTTNATFTGYDMSATGEQTVTVTYTSNNVSVTQTYNITINPIPTKTIAQFIAAGGGKCYLVGTISNDAENKYGNYDLTDDSGTIYIYGTLTSAGVSQQYLTLGIGNGDMIKVLADEYVYFNNTTHEAKNVRFIEKIEATKHNLTVNAANGSVEITGKTLDINNKCEVAENTSVTATATPAEHYTFASWSAEGVTLSDATANPLTFTMPTNDVTLTATFTEMAKHTATFYVQGVAAGSDANVYEGDAITFPTNITVPTGYTLVGWTTAEISGAQAAAPSPLVSSATMGTADVSYYAVFAIASGSVATLTKMTGSDTFASNDKVVVVAEYTDPDSNTTTNYGMYQETASVANYVNKWVFDNSVETVAADNKKWFTVSDGSTSGTWKLGDDTNGYVYNASSNNLIVSIENATDFTLTWNSTESKFTLVGNGRWLSYRYDLANNYFRMGGATTGTASGIVYFDIYKYVPGNGSYSDYCTTVNATATIPAGKEWITFCSTENLDFTSDIAGLEGAYTITAHADKATTLTATKMTGKVKAGTGLLLHIAEPKTTAQLISVPVATTGDEQADNMLKGVTADTEVQPTAGDYTNLGLSNGEFHPYSAAGTLAAGKAYLQIPTAQMPTGGNNARLHIVLDGEATGINAIENSELRIENLDAPMYNLAGQRVTKSYKGVVIVNGKKYINK